MSKTDIGLLVSNMFLCSFKVNCLVSGTKTVCPQYDTEFRNETVWCVA